VIPKISERDELLGERNAPLIAGDGQVERRLLEVWRQDRGSEPGEEGIPGRVGGPI
jgi:hypothetical protein